MASDSRGVFAPVEARTGDVADPPDRIALRDHVEAVEIGAFQSERGARQRVRFDIVVELRPLSAPLDDDVDRVLSYDTLTEAIAAELAAERLDLLETLAERIAARLLAEPRAARAFLRIEKLDRGSGALGVEIVRSRAAAAPRAAGAAPARPVVVFLSNAAIAAEELPGWLDRLAAGPMPVILCVAPPAEPAPRAAGAGPQRRIALLGMEQNAWVLAGRDGRCTVTATRTEIDWAVRQGRITVWAPSKMVLDAGDGAAAEPGDALALAIWLAGEMHAARLVAIGPGGGEAGDRPGFPVEALTIAGAGAAL